MVAAQPAGARFSSGAEAFLDRSRRREAAPDRPPARDARARGHAALEDPRAADLRVRPDLVGRVRDRGGARRPRRRVALGAPRVLPISIAIAALLAIVALSYTQTVQAYEIERRRLRRREGEPRHAAGLVAGAALLTDYILTVAVSVAAGIFAITSAAPSLGSHKVQLSLGCILVLTLVNLRGVRESGLLFAFPTYAFLARAVRDDRRRDRASAPSQAARRRTSRTRSRPGRAARASSSCAGVRVRRGGADRRRVDLERRDRVPAPAGAERGADAGDDGRRSRSRSSSASPTSRSRWTHGRARPRRCCPRSLARPSRPAPRRPSSTTSSRRSRSRFSILAANTSYQGFPRLAALLARDRFFPRQFVNLGDRLVYSNGIVVLAGRGRAPDRSLPRQRQLADPPVRDRRLHGVHARAGRDGALLAARRAARAGAGRRLMNGIGSATTGVVAVIVIATKFAAGAWMVIVAIPVMIAGFYAIRRHYRAVGRRLRAKAQAVLARPRARQHGRPLRRAARRRRRARRSGTRARSRTARCARSTFPFPGSDPGIRPSLLRLGAGRPAARGPSRREDEPLDAVLEYIWAVPHGEENFVTVVIPELFRTPSLLSALRRPTLSLKLGLLREPGVVVTDVPELRGCVRGRPGRAPARECVVPVSGRARRVAAGAHLRAVASPSRDEGGLLRVRRGRRGEDRARLAAIPDRRAARDRRRPVPRHRRPAASRTSARSPPTRTQSPSS